MDSQSLNILAQLEASNEQIDEEDAFLCYDFVMLR